VQFEISIRKRSRRRKADRVAGAGAAFQNGAGVNDVEPPRAPFGKPGVPRWLGPTLDRRLSGLLAPKGRLGETTKSKTNQTKVFGTSTKSHRWKSTHDKSNKSHEGMWCLYC
jgi:hypothetical protein